ncbi:hypothetical protein [Polystyrenella longa]|nr:hypothetical protein [Polystyrenella longa]
MSRQIGSLPALWGLNPSSKLNPGTIPAPETFTYLLYPSRFGAHSTVNRTDK